MRSMGCIILTFAPMTAVSAATAAGPPEPRPMREVDAQIVSQDVGVARGRVKAIRDD